MQKKIMNSLAAFMITASAVAQQPLWTVTTNNNRLPEKDATIAIAISPDSSATSFNLYVQNGEKKRIELQIIHPSLGVLVDTSFSNDQFKCRYNFEEVEDGRYQLKLSSGKEMIIRDIEINTVTRRSMVVR